MKSQIHTVQLFIQLSLRLYWMKMFTVWFKKEKLPFNKAVGKVRWKIDPCAMGLSIMHLPQKSGLIMRLLCMSKFSAWYLDEEIYLREFYILTCWVIRCRVGEKRRKKSRNLPVAVIPWSPKTNSTVLLSIAWIVSLWHK